MGEIPSEQTNVLPTWAEPPEHGIIYSGKVIEKYDNYLVFITKNGDKGVIKATHLDDDAMLSLRVFKTIKIKKILSTIVFLESSEKCNFFTAKQLLAYHKTTCLHSGFCLKTNERYYGYIDEKCDFGYYIKFIGGARGITNEENLVVGDTVCITVLKSRILPKLAILYKNYYINHLDGFLERMNSSYSRSKYFIGYSFLSLYKYQGEKIDDDVIYHIDDYELIVNEPEPDNSSCTVVDIIDNRIFAIRDNYSPRCDPPIACLAKVIYSSELYCILRFKNWLMICRNINSLKKDEKAYITLAVDVSGDRCFFKQIRLPHECSISLYIAYHEKFNTKLSEINQYKVIRHLNEWYICMSEQQKYFLHRTQVSHDYAIGTNFYAKCLKLLGLNLLIIDENLPLLYKDCKINMNVKAAIIKPDYFRSRHYIRISPFIQGTIKEKWISHVENITFACVINEIKENAIKCITTSLAYDAIVCSYVDNDYYTVMLQDGSVSKLDIHDCTKLNLNLGDAIKVYLLNSTQVSMYVSDITYAEPQIGSVVDAYVIESKENEALVHIGRNLYGILPIDLYRDFFETKRYELPKFDIKCVIIDKNNGNITLSRRSYDVYGKNVQILENKAYRAYLIDQRKNKAYIEVLDLITDIIFDETIEVKNGDIFYAICTSQEKKRISLCIQ